MLSSLAKLGGFVSVPGVFRAFAIVVVAALLGAIVVSVPQRAEALSGTGFDPGKIISDSQFYNRDAMSQDQIQQLLDAQIGACQNSLCLNVLRVNTPTKTLDFGTCATYIGEPNESAARIIYKVQQACAISAKVLLVTLQKEQGLVTSKAPTESVLRKALGQGCPDTATCDSAYYGFFFQVFSAARQFAWYGNPAGSHTSIKVGQYNAISFHPNVACGSANVLIQNRATAALYYYTPYQPNPAALANLGGVGDACSSYGNRNFWDYYTTWFGSPTGDVDPMAAADRVELVVTAATASIEVSGWAMDRANRNQSIEVSAYVDKPNGTTDGYALQANKPRPDVGAAYGSGDLHGFSASIPVTQTGTYRICLFPLTINGAALLTCRTLTAAGASPTGSLDGTRIEQNGAAASVYVGGWSIDRQRLDSATQTHIYVDRPNGTTTGVAVAANTNRPDIANAFPGAGAAHGYATNIPISSAGTYRVCAYSVASSAFGQVSESLGCKTVTAKSSAPLGSLDGVTLKATTNNSATIEVNGWAFDDALPASQIPVDLYVDKPNGTTSGTRMAAGDSRTDIGRAFPAAGSAHGFQASVPVEGSGTYRVCAFAIGTSAFGAANSLIGCSNVAARFPATFGALDSVSVNGSGADRKIVASGWAADPAAATASIPVDVYIDRPLGQTSGTRVAAANTRTDVGKAFPEYGQNHGFAASVGAVEPGSYRACAFAITVNQFGSNTLLGCSTVVLGG